jgi:hypothetical protein
MLPTIAETPLEEISRVKKATRVTLVVGETKGEDKQGQALGELSKIGNLTLRVSPDLGYYGCSRDSEEILFTPYAKDDSALVGLASTEDGYIELFEKMLAPALLGSSYDLKEPKPQATPRKPKSDPS